MVFLIIGIAAGFVELVRQLLRASKRDEANRGS
jgi:hypothetical protein